VYDFPSIADQPYGSKIPHVLVDRSAILDLITIVTLETVVIILFVSHCPPVIPLDQFCEITRLFCPPDESVLE
jgi:hypothetical protein